MNVLLRSAIAALLIFPAGAQAAVETVTGAKGLSAWVIQEHAVPTFTLKIIWKESGAAHDPKGKEGLASLVAESLTEGAGDMSSLAFQKALESKAIRISTSADADTISVTLTALSEYREDALKLLGLMLTKPRFDAEAVARMKKEAATAIRQRQEDPELVAEDAWHALAFAKHPYGRAELGTPSSLTAITSESLRRFWRAHAARDALLIAAAGDISPSELEPFIASLEAALPEAQKAEAPIAEAVLPLKGEKKIEANIPQTVVLFGVQGITRSDPRYYTAYVLNHIYGGGELDTRLMEALRGEKGLVYYAYTFMDDLRHGVAWRGAFASATDKVPEAMAILHASLQKLAQKGVTGEELADAKLFLTGSFPLKISSNGGLADYMIAMQYHHLGQDFLEKRNSYIQSVSLADINALARTLLDGREMVTVMVGKTPEGRK